MFVFYPGEGVRGGEEALEPNISPFSACWRMCGDTSAQRERPCLDKTWQTRGPCPGGMASVDGRTNIDFQNLWGEKKKISVHGFYVSPAWGFVSPRGTLFLGFRPTKLNCQIKEWQDRRLQLTFGSQAETMSLHHHSSNLPLEKDQTNVPVAQTVPEETTCKQQQKLCQQIPKGKLYHFNNNFGAGSSNNTLDEH